MSISFEDLLLAKVLAEDGLLSLVKLKDFVRRLDVGGGSLLEMAVEEGLLSRTDPRLSQAQIKMERYLFMMQDTLFADQVKKSGLVSKESISQARGLQRREGYNRSLAEILTRNGQLERHNLAKIHSLTLPHINKHRESILAKYREEDFAGIGRPLTKRRGKNDSMRLQRVRSGSGRNKVVKPALELRGKKDKGSHLTRRVSRGTMAMAIPREAGWSEPKNGDPSDPYIGRRIGQRYTLSRKLGQGAMGMVYLASDPKTDQQFAVKLVLNAVKKQDIVKRFRREILATSFFDHENVVNIYDAGETQDGAFFMALEYLEGEELSHVLKREGPLDLIRAVDLLTQLLHGLSAAHSANVVHKDVKPENLMLTKRHGQDFIKLMDFGLAIITDAAEEFGDKIYQTTEGQVTGSPAYMAPEVVSKDNVGPHSDLYSVGISLFEMLTGKHPYQAKTVREYISAHLYKKPRSLKTVRPDLSFPDTMQHLLDLLLAKQLFLRPKTCEAVLTFIQDQVEPHLLED